MNYDSGFVAGILPTPKYHSVGVCVCSVTLFDCSNNNVEQLNEMNEMGKNTMQITKRNKKICFTNDHPTTHTK